MAEEGFKSQLTAILSADVEDYSRFIREIEEAAICALQPLVNLSAIIQKHGGEESASSVQSMTA